MEEASELMERIRQQAALVIQSPDAPEPAAALAQMLAQLSDREQLEKLAERLAFYPEVAVPICSRLLEVAPDDAELALRVGYLYFSAGEDDRAAECLTRATALEGETARVLHLAATMARDNAEKKRLYTKIVMLEPRDKQAWHHLLALRN